MKKVWMLAALAMMALQGFAEETPATRAAAEKLLELFNMDQTFEQTMKQAAQMPMSMIDSQNLTESEKEQAKTAVESSMQITMDNFTWEKMKGMFVDIYADVLSLEELQGLIAFYESPIGQSFVKKQPQLTAATIQKMQGLMQELMPRIQEEVAKSLQSAKPAVTAEEKEEEEE